MILLPADETAVVTRQSWPAESAWSGTDAKRRLADYGELTKPKLTGLAIATAWFGYSLASRGHLQTAGLIQTLLFTWFVACGAIALNQYLERELDAKMRRTQRRPLPQKRLRPRQAFLFAAGLSAAGVLGLALRVNGLAAALAAASSLSYLFAYTPLKRYTPLCTLVGAVPGALPPLIGWAAASGRLAPEAWVLFAIMFLWQLPHFLAIAWMYRDDYARAGFLMLPVIDPEGRSTGRIILLCCAVLIPVTLAPARLGLTGPSYLWGATSLGIVFFAFGASMALYRTPAVAKRLLIASVIYLPTLLAWMAFS